jgi:phosphoribosylanthranilate isomerase
MTRAKICGITNIEDALVAVEAGADALGFIFAESPRRVDAATVSGIVGNLPGRIATVGVFANQSADEVFAIMNGIGLHFAQVHGDLGEAKSTPIGQAPWGLIRALRIKSAHDIWCASDDDLFTISDAIVLDTHVEGMMGGTGRTFDWDLAVEAQSLGKPIILAGGLNPSNVAEAIQKVRPYAVDVSSGVEVSPGRKDHDKIREFIHNVRTCT